MSLEEVEEDSAYLGRVLGEMLETDTGHLGGEAVEGRDVEEGTACGDGLQGVGGGAQFFELRWCEVGDEMDAGGEVVDLEENGHYGNHRRWSF